VGKGSYVVSADGSTLIAAVSLSGSPAGTLSGIINSTLNPLTILPTYGARCPQQKIPFDLDELLRLVQE
jgi:hypothetical protein